VAAVYVSPLLSGRRCVSISEHFLQIYLAARSSRLARRMGHCYWRRLASNLAAQHLVRDSIWLAN